ncbi:MAG: DnaJ domain-containing protein [Nanohaloarchaea archaeon]|nr:DnaJ domain-containing protein [Candidatus Nanohaloarchaea archaeon]
MVNIKGHDIDVMITKVAFNRKALQFNNNIIAHLKSIGVDEYDIEIPFEQIAIKKAKASVTWYMDGHRLYCSHNLQRKFVDNIYVLSKVIEAEVNLVLSKEKTLADFYTTFKEDKDIEKKRNEAREFFGVAHDETDWSVIDRKYKILARDLHPDMPTGDTERFKKLNDAHKTLKREFT